MKNKNLIYNSTLLILAISAVFFFLSYNSAACCMTIFSIALVFELMRKENVIYDMQDDIRELVESSEPVIKVIGWIANFELQKKRFEAAMIFLKKYIEGE